MKKCLAALFRRQQISRSSADIAKKRLQIIISADKTSGEDHVMAQFKQDLLDLIARNFNVSIDEIQESVKVDMGQRNGQSTLELNITLPNQDHVHIEGTV